MIIMTLVRLKPPHRCTWYCNAICVVLLFVNYLANIDMIANIIGRMFTVDRTLSYDFEVAAVNG